MSLPGRDSWEVINKRRKVVCFFIVFLAFPSSHTCPLLPLLGSSLKPRAVEGPGATRRGGRATLCPAFRDTALYISHPSPAVARAESPPMGNRVALGWKKRVALPRGIPEHPLPSVAACPLPAERCRPARVANSPAGLLVAMSLSLSAVHWVGMCPPGTGALGSACRYPVANSVSSSTKASVPAVFMLFSKAPQLNYSSAVAVCQCHPIMREVT